jgi:hypothetical protein
MDEAAAGVLLFGGGCSDWEPVEFKFGMNV